MTAIQSTMEKKRPSEFGFSPSADAAVNVAALQRALDGGGRVIIDVPGVYDLNATIMLDSDTQLLCAPGVVFRKVASYCNVLINRGALTKQYNRNITIDGLEISVNNFEAFPTLVYGLRAQLGFFYVKNLTLRNFTCLDGKENQYLIYIVTWSNLRIENVKLAGDKDGIKLNNGHNALIENLDLTTYDDGTSLCGTDYASTLLEAGDVYNVTYRNVIDRQYKNIFGRTCLIYTGSWADYADGNEYGAGDFCLHRGRLYQSTNEANFVALATRPPVHESGIVTGEDKIAWRFVQLCDFYQTNVYNITFENCTFEKSGNIIASFIVPAWYYKNICGIHRNFYPGTEPNSTSWNISINNCRLAGVNPQVLVNLMGNMRDVSINGCAITNPRSTLINIDHDSANRELIASIHNCAFPAGGVAPLPEDELPNHEKCPILRQDIDDTGKLIVVRNDSRVICSASGNSTRPEPVEVFLSEGSKLQSATCDLMFKS
ncbi:MAG: hypothetical protein IT447_11200 [Phycisphaerales bacterium]|nr:hypothetical protein [Phycisphaerales bacterium]